MTFKEYGEEQDISFELTAKVNGVIVHMEKNFLPVFSVEKASTAVFNAVKEMYEELPEPIEDETQGHSDED